MAMTQRKRLWLWLIPALAALAAAGLAAGWLLFPTLPAGELQYRALGAILLPLLAGVALLVIVWALLDLRLLRPLHSVAAACEIAAHGRPGEVPQLPPRHQLGSLPAAIEALIGQLQEARHSVAKALQTGASEADQQRQRLELILRELDSGVLVCDAGGSILLYNPAALRILGSNAPVGLGRSIYALLPRAPLSHQLQLLRLAGESPAPGNRGGDFICSALDGQLLLQCRMTLLPTGDSGAAPTATPQAGFALSFEDATRRIDGLRRRDGLLHALLEGQRGPLANLRAAGENLSAHPEMDAASRARFVRVVADESQALSAQLARAADGQRRLAGAQWLLVDAYSADLFAALQHRLAPSDIEITATGMPLWLHVDSNGLLALLEHLLRRTATHTGQSHFDVEALLGDNRVYLDIIWRGERIADSTLFGWLEEALPEATAGAITAAQVVELHDSELWSQRHPRREALALLRLPLPASPRQWQAPREKLPPRPEFYDFELASADHEHGPLADRRLDELEFVVFDCETTGLRPSQGDAIVALGAVRVVNGRLLGGESFERLINPGRPIPRSSTRFHGIDDAIIADKPPLEVVLPQFHDFVGEQAVLVAHNAAFDMRFLKLAEQRAGVEFNQPVLDLLLLGVWLHPEESDHTLEGSAARFGIDLGQRRHSALGDSLIGAELLLRLLPMLRSRGIETLGEALAAGEEMLEVRRRQAQF